MAAKSGRAAKKLFHKIGEVCELTKTEPYVLRYWESEFPFLAPEKNRAGQRIYSDDDIQTVLAIKRLLYEEGYTTAGARRRLEQERREGGAAGSTPPEEGRAENASSPAPATQATATAPSEPGRDARLEQALLAVREELKALRASLSDL